MSESVENKAKKRPNWIVFVILSLLIVVFPAVSWLYLREGFNWRKEAVEELQNYGKVHSAPILFPEGKKVDRTEGNVCVVHIFGQNPDLTPANRQILDTNEKLFEQFGTSPHFRIVMVAEGGTAEFRSYMQKKKSVDFVTSVYTGGVKSWSKRMDASYEMYVRRTNADPSMVWYALTDTTGTIRRYYNALDEKEVSRMVQQIAILLPQ